MIYFISVVIIIAIFSVIIWFWAKKEGEVLKEMLSNLTEDQKKKLEDNEVGNFDDKKNTWIQRGMIGKVIDKNNKVALKVLWYNTVIQNATLNQCQFADINMKKDVFEAHGLKEGDFVKIFINPEDAKAQIIFD